MYIIKATFKDINTNNTFDCYVGKVLKNKVSTIQNRSISFDSDKVLGYKSLQRCRKAMYLYFLEAKEKVFKIGFLLSVNPMEVNND